MFNISAYLLSLLGNCHILFFLLLPTYWCIHFFLILLVISCKVLCILCILKIHKIAFLCLSRSWHHLYHTAQKSVSKRDGCRKGTVQKTKLASTLLTLQPCGRGLCLTGILFSTGTSSDSVRYCSCCASARVKSWAFWAFLASLKNRYICDIKENIGA